jgi:hypothetical protein
MKHRSKTSEIFDVFLIHNVGKIQAGLRPCRWMIIDLHRYRWSCEQSFIVIW